jgi:hypothetical protein
LTPINLTDQFYLSLLTKAQWRQDTIHDFVFHENDPNLMSSKCLKLATYHDENMNMEISVTRDIEMDMNMERSNHKQEKVLEIHTSPKLNLIQANICSAAL